MEWVVEFWGQRAIGCRMRSWLCLSEFHGLIHSPARDLTSDPGPSRFSWIPANLRSLYLPTKKSSANG